MSHKRKVLVIFGGKSSEHEISRISAASVIKNIDTEKFEVAMLGITKEGKWLPYNGDVEMIPTGQWEELSLKSRVQVLGEKDNLINYLSDCKTNFSGIDNIDVVFPVLHGCNGEDGTIQGFFELASIPYVGCGVLGSALCMDKVYTKMVFEKIGIPQARHLHFTRKEIERDISQISDKIEAEFDYPVFVKPSNAGSSVGVSKASNKNELFRALNYASRYDKKVMVEEFINGREVECAVLGNDEPIASIVGEIVPSNDFYDYKAKYIDNKSKMIIPADLPKDTVEKVRDYAVKAFKALDCSGLSRVDFFVDKETDAVFINEINTMPGFTSISMYPALWEASGISYGELIERLIDLAVERYEDNKKQIND
ncbi:UNVERIFIED_CONTAM: D-alanine-D-alanine ligase [Acetivibrio alkalicellulosi]